MLCAVKDFVLVCFLEIKRTPRNERVRKRGRKEGVNPNSILDHHKPPREHNFDDGTGRVRISNILFIFVCFNLVRVVPPFHATFSKEIQPVCDSD